MNGGDLGLLLRVHLRVSSRRWPIPNRRFFSVWAVCARTGAMSVQDMAREHDLVGV